MYRFLHVSLVLYNRQRNRINWMTKIIDNKDNDGSFLYLLHGAVTE